MEIRGFNNYLIYPDGKVLNKTTNKYKKHTRNTNGYYQVCLSNEGHTKNLSVHRLIALHHIPNPDNKPCVDHIDRNKLNNNINNLRWATHLENQQNLGKYKTNKSGHKNIHYLKSRKTWIYQYRVMGKVIYRKKCKCKITLLTYKFCYLLLSKR